MAMSRRALCALLLVVLAPLFWIVGPGADSPAEAIPTPVVASDNVELLTTIPGSAAISGEFSPSAPYFYTSGLDSISVFDISDPKAPKLTGKLPNLTFENESMTYGERRDASGKVVKRFVLVGVDLYQAAPSNPPRGNVGGGEVVVVDVTDPAAPAILGRTPQGSPLLGSVTTSSHTVQCVTVTCNYAYTAGDANKFSIIDLTNLAEPKQIATPRSPASGSGPISQSGAGHYWDIDDTGLAWHTGGGGTAVFDVSDPRNPVALNATNPQGTETPYNDFIHHNSMRPNGRAFKPGQAPSLANGNVVLVTEEDYASEGDEVVCDRSGTFQTWELPDLDGAAYRAGNPQLVSDKGDIKPLDIFQAPNEAGGGLSTPIGGFCSAHWFDYHQSGIVAQGWYQQGMRLIDVRDPKNIKQFGFFTAGASQVWDAYWVPARNADGTEKAGREKTNIVYTADLVRGLDVFEVKNMPAPIKVNTPEDTTPPADTTTTPGTTPTTTSPNTGAPTTKDAGSGGSTSGGSSTSSSAQGTAATKEALNGSSRCAAPTSTFGRGTRLRRSGVRLRGAATPGAGCKLAAVSVAIGRKVGKQCRFMRSSGRFGKKVNCRRTTYVKARGTTRWSFDKTLRLPRGSYNVWSRAINTAGTRERKSAKRNLTRLTVR